MPEAPTPGTTVNVDVAQSGTTPPAHDLASEVQAVALGLLVLSAQSFPEELLFAPRTTALTMHWTTARGMHSAPGVLERVRRGPHPAWYVRPVGAVEVVQRRRFARAPVDSSVAVVPQVHGLNRVLGGWLVDLGEGGARARVEVPAQLDPGVHVELHVRIEEISAAFSGTVLRVEPSADGRRASDVVVEFEDPVPHADRIRRSVMRAQVQLRNEGRW